MKNIHNKALNRYSFNSTIVLFLFQVVFREINLPIDIRLLTIVTSCLSILTSSSNRKLLSKSNVTFIIAFFLFSMLGSLRVLLNFNIITGVTLNLIVLYAYNLLVILAMFTNRKLIDFKIVYVSLLLFMIINLFVSVYLSLGYVFSYLDTNYTLPLTNIRGFIFGNEHYNFFGLNFRVSGYTEDANFLAFNSFILMVLSLISFEKNRKIAVVGFGISILQIMLSGSKTVLIIFVISGILLHLRRKKRLSFTFLISVVFLSTILLALLFNKFDLGVSMNNRMLMWNEALELFGNAPLLGSGISSFRTHFFESTGWMVHSHSYYMQVLSEQGLLGVFLFFTVYLTSANSIKNNRLILLYSSFFLFSINFDLSYTNYIVLFIALFPLLDLTLEPSGKSTEKVTTIFQLSNGLSNGGAERMVYDLCSGLSRSKNYKIYLILTDRDDPDNHVDGLFDTENIQFKVIKLSDKKHDLLRNNFRLYKLINKYHPDVVHTHQITLMYCLIGYLFGSYCTKVHTVHNDSHLEFGSKTFRIFYHILFVVFRIHLVSISNYIKQTSLTEYNLLNKQMHHMIYNGRSFDESSDVSNYLNRLDSHIITIIMVGRLTDVKNHQFAIEAFNILINLRKDHRFVLEIYGEGPLKDHLIEIISDYNLQNYVFLKGVTANIKEKLDKSHIFLMSSIHEGFPISAIEALRQKLPLLLSEFGSAYELIQNNGFIFSLESHINLVEILQKVADHKENLKLFSDKSFELSEEFTMLGMIENYSYLYNEILND